MQKECEEEQGAAEAEVTRAKPMMRIGNEGGRNQRGIVTFLTLTTNLLEVL
jgi:hypothetical protein